MADGFPGSGRESQPTILVSGRSRELLRRVPLQLFGERALPSDCAVIATTRDDPAFVARRLSSGVDAFEAKYLAIVDCCTKQRDSMTKADEMRWEVPSPVSFTQTSEAVGEALDSLAELGLNRTHFLFDTLTTQFRLADADHVLQHAHDIAMTVGSEDGLGIWTVEHAAVTDQEFEQLKHFFDVHVEVRRADDGPEVRWIGLVGSSNGWVTLADTGIRFDAFGKSLG